MRKARKEARRRGAQGLSQLAPLPSGEAAWLRLLGSCPACGRLVTLRCSRGGVVLSLSVAHRATMTESLAQGRGVQALGGYHAATGLVHALGFDASTGARELVDLDPI